MPSADQVAADPVAARPPAAASAAARTAQLSDAVPPVSGSAADITLRLLMLEDSVLDHELLVATLQREGLTIQCLRVQTADALRDALAGAYWDAVIANHQLPGFSSLEALEMVRGAIAHCPFIIVSEVTGEDAAVVAMRRGVDDYLVKGRLARLVPSLFNALAAAEARRERAAARAALERSEVRLHELLAHLETVVDSERSEIAREIHDDIGSALTALRLDMNWIGQHGDRASAARAAQAMQTLAEMMDCALRLQQRLRPAVLDQGLVPALRWLADDAARRSAIAISFACNTEQVEVDTTIALAAYRTLQESLTNIHKHAGATSVSVGLVAGKDQVSLEIADDGCGIREADRNKPTSFGLRGMSERAERLGGWLEVSGAGEGSAGRGTVVLLSLPLQVEGRGIDTTGRP